MGEKMTPSEKQSLEHLQAQEQHKRRENLLRILFQPIQGSLDAMKSARKEQIPDRSARANVLRVELVRIGDHIQNIVSKPELQDGRGDINVFKGFLWEYAARWWPNPSSGGEQIRDMYRRIKEAQDWTAGKEKNAGAGEEASKTEGEAAGAAAVVDSNRDVSAFRNVVMVLERENSALKKE